MAQVHPHAQIAEKLWSAVAEGDSAALEQVLAPDVVWSSVGDNKVAGEYHGPAAVMEYLATIGELADPFVSKLNEIYVGSGGAIILHSVTASRNNKRLEMDYLLRLDIREGRITNVLSVPVDQQTNDKFWT